MRRLATFFAIFCVGFVLFMILTGQMSRFFEQEDPFAAEKWERRQDDRNLFTYHCPDVSKGRDRFTIRGVISSGAPLKIDAAKLDEPGTLTDAVLEMPVYGDAAQPDRATGVFRLEASEVTYDPRAQAVTMGERIVGSGEDGTRFETSALEVTWGESREIVLRGDAPLQAEYPALELFGEQGFTGVVAGRAGLERVEVHPPVVLAVDEAEGGGFFGVGKLSAGGSATDERIFLVSEGPLHITQRPQQSETVATFEGRVSIFRAPKGTPLHPRPSVPVEHFECDRLLLTLDTAHRRVREARAEGIDRDVRASFVAAAPDGPTREYELAAKVLTWDEERQEALFTGPEGVRVEGHIGVFRARRARVLPGEGRCVLEEELEARVHGAHLGVKSEDNSRLESDWQLTADRGLIHFGDRSSAGDRFRFIQASSREPDGVLVRELRENGAELRGSRFEYDPQAGALTVLGFPGSADSRPRFSDAESHVTADEIALVLARRSLRFRGGVVGHLVGLPEVGPDELPEWLPEDSASGRTTVRCGELELTWSGDHRLAEIRAQRGSEPVVLAHRGREDVRVIGERISWRGRDHVLRVEGSERQRLVARNGAVELEAGRVAYDLAAWRVVAGGRVECDVDRSLLTGGEEKAGHRTLHLSSETLELELEPAGGSRAKAGEDSAAGEQPRESSPVRRAVARGTETDLVTVDDGLMRASGREMEWRADSGRLVLEGGGRQTFTYRGPNGEQTVSADRIELREEGARGRCILVGEVDGALLQGFARELAPKRRGTSAGPERPLRWRVRADRVEALLGRAAARSDGGSAVVVLELDASGGLQLDCEEERIRFQGSACSWNRQRNRFRLFAPEGQGLQTLYRGREPHRDEIVAREVVVVRERGRAGEDELWAFFQDVLRGTVHLEEELLGAKTRQKQPEVPDLFTLQTQNLLVRLDLLGEDAVQRLREVHAWGAVDFRGGSKRVTAARCVYRGENRSVTFHGRPGAPPRIEEGSQVSSRSDPVVLQQVRRGFRVIEQGVRVKPDDLGAILELLDKKGRAPRP